MRTLRIESGSKIFIDGALADLNQVDNKEEFIASMLTLDVELDDTTVGDIIHLFYDAKGLVKSIFSEEYEVVRALATSNNLPRNFKHIRFYKSFKIESEIMEDNQEFIYMIPEIEVVESGQGEDGVKSMSGLPIIIDENIELSYEDKIINSKTKLNLFDVMTCLFDELPALMKEGVMLS